MSGYKQLLDTNIVLYLLNGDETIAEFLQGTDAYLSVITELELIGYADLSATELKSIKYFLSECMIIGITEHIKELYARIRRKYRLKMGDAIVAATSIYLDIPLISADKDFKKVEELNLAYYEVNRGKEDKGSGL